MARTRLIAVAGVRERRDDRRAGVWVNHNRCRLIQQPPGRESRDARHSYRRLNRWETSVNGGVLQTYKPGSVSLPEGRAVTIYLAQPPAVKPAEVRFWRSGVTAAVKRPTRGRAGRLSPPIWPCSRWGLAAAASPQTAGRSYRPISPLSFPYGKDGMFLCHFPFPMTVRRTCVGTWELPSTLPRGARTFLPPSPAGKTAVTQSA